MSMKNKAEVNKGIKSGKINFKASTFFQEFPKDPLMFANSDEFRKIQNRNRKNR